MNVGGWFHFTYCLKLFLYYGKDQYEMSGILLYLQLQKIMHLRFCTFCILCSLDALALITYFRLQMVEDLKGTVLHFLSHHLYFLNLDRSQSISEDLSSIEAILKTAVTYQVCQIVQFLTVRQRTRNLNRRKILNQNLFDCIKSLEKWFLAPSVGSLLVPCSLECPGACFIGTHLSWLALLCSAEICLFTAAKVGVGWIISWLFKVNQLLVLKWLFLKHLLRFWKYLALSYLKTWDVSAAIIIFLVRLRFCSLPLSELQKSLTLVLVHFCFIHVQEQQMSWAYLWSALLSNACVICWTLMFKCLHIEK